MSWQDSIRAAVKALRDEEGTLQKQLSTIRVKIAGLQAMGRGRGGAPKGRRGGPRKLSAAGRAAISRAAKRRWAEYRRGLKQK